MAVLIPLIRFYRRCISPFLGPHCRYHPSCSVFAEEAISEHGLIRGACMALCRLLRCNPFFPGGYDPVPGKVNSRNKNNG